MMSTCKSFVSVVPIDSRMSLIFSLFSYLPKSRFGGVSLTYWIWPWSFVSVSRTSFQLLKKCLWFGFIL